MTYSSGSWKPQRTQRRSRTGRGRVMEMLDRLMADNECREVIREALTAEMQKHPLRFFRTVIMPLLPQADNLPDKRPLLVGWRSLLSAPAIRAPDCGQEVKVLP